MSEAIMVALIGLAGSGIGAFVGVVTSAKLTQYRLQELEKKVDKHNGFAERIPVIEEHIKNLDQRVDDLEKKVG